MNRGSSTTISTKVKATFKIVVVGQRGVGKTSLLMRYDRGVFCKTYAVTIGVQSFSKQALVGCQKIALQLWDTTGQYGFKSLAKSFYSQASCVIVAYSDPQQLNKTLGYYLNEIQEFAAENAFVAVVRTKIDLIPQSTAERELLECYQKDGKINLWMEISSKQGINVQNFFEDLSTLLLQQYEDDYQFRTLVSPKKKDSIYLSKSGLDQLNIETKTNCCKN